MVKSTAEQALKTTWRARGLPPMLVDEIERRDGRRRRVGRVLTVVSLGLLAGSGIYHFTTSQPSGSSLIASSIAAGTRGVEGLASVASVAMTAQPKPVETAKLETRSQAAAVLSAPVTVATPTEMAVSRKIADPASTASDRPVAETVATAAAPAAVATPAPPTTTVVAAAAPAEIAIVQLPPVQPQPAPVQIVSSPPQPIVVAAAAPTAGKQREPPAHAPCVDEVATAARQTVFWFDVGSAELSLTQGALLMRLADVLVRCPSVKLEVSGHTDTVGIDNNNFALSWRRAEAVRGALEREGVAADRLAPVGYGPRDPLPLPKSVAVRDSKEQNALNRRVEFKIR
jgi:outer membrane protein OmpA-like peptidoglycan-associated protein